MKSVTVYTVSNCPDDQAVGYVLACHDVPLTEKNVREDPAALALDLLGGGR